MKLIDLNEQPQWLPVIARWHFDEWQALYPNETLDYFEADLKACLGAQTVPTTWLLMEGDQVLGTTSVLKSDLHTHTHLSPWVANVYIVPECRGQGLGRLLIGAVLKRLKAAGLGTVYLFTEDQTRFYEGLGFRELERTQLHDATVSVMSTQLND
ncbi:GNAT family N-acetyltransferase [Thalassolituus sp. LLYu03]|uniref:GNAT family N-acetyltransferase n=1 Tax=Thalassolituus sp. LLYu03 TaxID=3421656 RepID=UPI003D26ACC4